MKEFIKIGARILMQMGDHLPEEGLYINRKHISEELKSLPDALRRDVLALREKLNKSLPDDFNYWLNFGSDGPSFALDYEDGMMSMFCNGHHWKNERSIFEQIGELDWQAERTLALTASKTFDGIKESTKDLPPRIPKTDRLQYLFNEDMERFLKETQAEPSKIHVLLWDEEIHITYEKYDKWAQFVWQLPNLMTCQHRTIAVVKKGKILSTKEIDKLNLQAIKDLKGMPISISKASGHWSSGPLFDEIDKMAGRVKGKGKGAVA
jgi:hypothetical protein